MLVNNVDIDRMAVLAANRRGISWEFGFEEVIGHMLASHKQFLSGTNLTAMFPVLRNCLPSNCGISISSKKSAQNVPKC